MFMLFLITFTSCEFKNQKEYDSSSSETQEKPPKKEMVSEIPSFIKNTIYRKTYVGNSMSYRDYSYTPPRQGRLDQVLVEVKDKNIRISGNNLLPIKHKIISSKFYDYYVVNDIDSHKRIAVLKTNKGEVQIFLYRDDVDFYIKDSDLIIGDIRFNEETYKEEFSFQM